MYILKAGDRQRPVTGFTPSGLILTADDVGPLQFGSVEAIFKFLRIQPAVDEFTLGRMTLHRVVQVPMTPIYEAVV